MKKVTGIGGIFFKAKDTKVINDWYKKNLGLQTGTYGVSFEWKEKETDKVATTQWAPFKVDTSYFEPSEKEFMINYRVENLDLLLEELKKENVKILDEIQTYDYGKFLHILDPEGNKIELWEPLDQFKKTFINIISSHCEEIFY